ncbi:glycoside hydrolase family 2 protein [Chryseosolibacter indicus]|uniref:Beta-galactosidase n=1 Tax=Chryseosolibacter indicus TaxID=2782351 RepID=A0ABS5VVZ9_9BACT|nr:glycoside hydrolase family 2 TIM barrel-domain containing protein [Chryseosolibacter indicus]MBT1705613.1 glycoside hydrolase family 2 [Chryseosolibacter indicus]
MLLRFTFISVVVITAGIPAYSQKKSYQTEIKYLSGTDNSHTVTWDFWCTGGRKSGYWTTIEVPSHWEQQGFGGYNYGRDYVTYGKNFRFEEEKGLYRYNFTIPKHWKNKTINIVFEGSMTDTEVKINGKVAGDIHRGSFYRFSYDITNKLNFSEPNLLEVTVSKMSSDGSVNNAERLADYWIFGGIFRPVYLEAHPKEHIVWCAIDAKADGTFSMNASLKNTSSQRQLVVDIVDNNGKTISTLQSASKTDTVAKVNGQIMHPLLWTAETPHLYTAKIALKKGSKILHQTTEKFGFRTIEIRKGDGVYLNGTKIKMKGVNRHVWWPETGRCVNSDIDLMDAKLIKEMNMNAVRCSHYPPDKAFLQICDSLGLYVLNELAGWQKAYSTETGERLVKEMVKRDVNHPSIIFWSNGNEGGHNKDLDDDYAKYDLSNRPVIHAHHRPGNHFNGIDCNHYEDYYSTKKILADSLIYMPTEFLHAQDDGGGAAALSDFWELHWKEKKGAGGFLWALVDEGVVRTDFDGAIDVNGVNAPDGLLGPHREKEGSFYSIREIYAPVKIKMNKISDTFNGEIILENRYHFTNLNQCTFNWSLINFRKSVEFLSGYDTLQNGIVSAPSIKPLDSGKLKLPLPPEWKNYDALMLSAYDQSGSEIYTWTWKIKPNEKLISTILTYDAVSKVEATETDTTVSMKASGITVSISKKNGLLTHLTNDFSTKLSFKNGPSLVQGKSRFKSLTHYKDDTTYCVKVSYEGDLKYILWRMQPSGWLEMEYEYQLNGSFPFTGVTFSYPENFMLGIKYLGKGPYRVWKNRMQGTTYNVWQKMNNNAHTGSGPWIYPEFKGYYADISWVEFNTVEGKFTVATKGDNLFLRLFNFYALSGKQPHPELPHGDISFLDNIPPIGTKLALNINTNTSSLGPASEPNHVHSNIKRTLYFYFGTPKTSGENRQFVMPSINILTD